jgi:hypothetical protein
MRTDPVSGQKNEKNSLNSPVAKTDEQDFRSNGQGVLQNVMT